MEYNAKNTSLSGWYNAPLFDSRTGCATAAMDIMREFVNDPASVDGVTMSVDEDANWYTLSGQRVAAPSQNGVYIHKGKKILRYAKNNY